jgi:hypothetical protein
MRIPLKAKVNMGSSGEGKSATPLVPVAWDIAAQTAYPRGKARAPDMPDRSIRANPVRVRDALQWRNQSLCWKGDQRSPEFINTKSAMKESICPVLADLLSDFAAFAAFAVNLTQAKGAFSAPGGGRIPLRISLRESPGYTG